MCFFTQQSAPKKDVKARFNATIEHEEAYMQSDEINGFLCPNIPIILDIDSEIIRTDFTWGLIPHWASDMDFREKKLNARIETVHEKPSYRDITQNRCLIIATAFYEWHWNDPKGKSKTKFKVNSKDEEIFCFAGLYDRWVNPVDGEIKYSYTMVTTEANELMQYVHNHKKRMPIMLHRKDESQWLDKSIKIDEFAYPYEANLIAVPTNKNLQYELF